MTGLTNQPDQTDEKYKTSATDQTCKICLTHQTDETDNMYQTDTSYENDSNILNGVCPIDDRPLSDKLHHFVRKKEKQM